MSDPVCGEEAVARVRDAIANYMGGCQDARCTYPMSENCECALAARAAIQAHTAALREAGFKIVGRDPDKAMLGRAYDLDGPTANSDEIWQAMWDAAPPHPPDTEGKI